MPASKQRIDYINSFNKERYTRYTLSIPKSDIEVAKKIEAMKKNRSMNAYIIDLIKKDLEKSKK